MSTAGQDEFDNTIGRLDRLLSEFLLLPEKMNSSGQFDKANKKTLKHHADDLIGVGQRMHEILHTPSSSIKPLPFSEEDLKLR